MKVKEKNINIVIENNLFSKNKEECCDKKKDDKKDDKKDNSKLPYVSRQVYEHNYNSSLSPEINAYYILQSQKRMMDFAVPPTYNNNIYTNPNQIPLNNINIDDIEKDIEEDIEEENAAGSEPPPAPIILFNENGKYIGDVNDINKHIKKYNEILKYINNRTGKKPQKRTLIRYGLLQKYNEMNDDDNS